MFRLFTKYLSVGVVNTLLHWIMFSCLVFVVSLSQATANLVAFCVAVTFSFFANAKFTFKKKATGRRYFAFLTFMGMLSYITGYIADKSNTIPVMTMVVFSAISLIFGFVYSNFFVFKGVK